MKAEELKNEHRLYPVPQKDGIETKYPDGTILVGGWASRLEKWKSQNLDRIPNEKAFEDYHNQKLAEMMPSKEDAIKKSREMCDKVSGYKAAYRAGFAICYNWFKSFLTKEEK